ncbi:phosphatase PAP2 family protein [Deinococcus sp.]|uniref:phosphatase PAP2 family protein n=1 Tax=Deinococcus sp. TaxID=47478 RepID=UPI002869BFAD|nr:phosphatase PAP2 family protein [Deinococcus sp.]
MTTSGLTRPPPPAHLLRWLAGILIPLVLVGVLAEDIAERERYGFETPVMLWIHAHAPAWLTQLSVFLHTFGGPVVMGGITVALLLALQFTHRHREALFTLLGLGSAVGISLGMKLIFNRPRPELWPRLVHESGASFPSGHSATAAALAAVLVFLLWRTPLRWPALILGVTYAVVSGVARLVLGVHFPTDVLAGWLMGLACVLGAARLTGISVPHPLQPRVTPVT